MTTLTIVIGLALGMVFVTYWVRPVVLFEALQREGVITRPMGGYSLPEWIRISIGSPAENERCLAALKRVLG